MKKSTPVEEMEKHVRSALTKWKKILMGTFILSKKYMV